MERYVIEREDTEIFRFWGRGHWWKDIQDATIYRTWRKAEGAAEKSLAKRDFLARIVAVVVTVRKAERAD